MLLRLAAPLVVAALVAIYPIRLRSASFLMAITGLIPRSRATLHRSAQATMGAIFHQIFV
jgi:hypothetical protein